MRTSEEQRHFHRVAHDAKARLSSPGQDWPCMVCDLSLKGCLLQTPVDCRLDPQQTFRVAITLAEDVEIGMEVVPIHQHGNLAGFRCVEIDLDGITELRRLVELNLGDPALLERDLRELGHSTA